MIDRIFRFTLQSFAVLFILILVTSVVFVADGLRDVEGHADVAVVPGHAELERGDPWAIVQPRIDRAIQLYRANACSAIIISGSDKNGYNEAGKMIEYMEGQGVPSSAIIGDEEGIDTRKMVVQWVEIMKAQNFNSVIIVTNYYQVTRLKIALMQEGVRQIGQAPIGTFQESDAYSIGRDVVAFYNYLIKYYLGPVENKVKAVAKSAKHAINL